MFGGVYCWRYPFDDRGFGKAGQASISLCSLCLRCDNRFR